MLFADSPFNYVLLLIPLVIAAAFFFRMMAGVMDHRRIARYLRARGGRVKAIHWAPFGPGWLGEKSDRIYTVIYTDSDGNDRKSSCKTSIMTGVYFTRDVILRHSTVTKQKVSLEEENRLLRAEVERLRKELGE